MFRYARLGLLLVLTALIAAPAQALPAPMSEQKLNDKSDLVAVVRVNTVICTAVTNDEATGEELPAYLAKLKLVEVKKGWRQTRRRGAGDLARGAKGHRRAVDRQLLSGRG
jgi:hypothetical protein